MAISHVPFSAYCAPSPVSVSVSSLDFKLSISSVRPSTSTTHHHQRRRHPSTHPPPQPSKPIPRPPLAIETFFCTSSPQSRPSFEARHFLRASAHRYSRTIASLIVVDTALRKLLVTARFAAHRRLRESYRPRPSRPTARRTLLNTSHANVVGYFPSLPTRYSHFSRRTPYTNDRRLSSPARPSIWEHA